MTITHGFEQIDERRIEEINSLVVRYRHVKTGAELLSVQNDDENKVFSITFATPPVDSTGLPHILEHSVLSGSRKYPVKEPFVELIKGSLATFINAFTFSDKTMYPVASQNLQDFYNLIDVYLDAVFYPRITPQTLAQEGWHHELEAPEGPLTYRGVVFNEMKGSYSSLDRVLATQSEMALYPDTIYANDSGGDPAVIPDLTYEAFKHFHETYYHPSNARIFMYGDDDPMQRLALLDAYLREFEQLDLDASIAPQAPFEAPRLVEHVYDAGEGEDQKAFVTVNWLLPEPFDAELSLALSILENALLGTQAAPLRKALLDSGYGEEVAGHGLEDGMRQMNFSTGMRGVRLEVVDQVERLIIETLQRLAEDGIDPAQVEASLNTVEFALREYNTGGFPRGLAMNIQTMGSWLYGGDPIEALAFEAPLSAVKARIIGGERYLEGLIQRHLLDNTSRVTVIMRPDATVREQREAAEKARLQREFEAMTEADKQNVIAQAQQLLAQQNAEDSPDDLAKLPFLKLTDLEREIRTVPTEQHTLAGATALMHDLFTNGIVYLNLGFDLRGFPVEWIPYLGLFGSALLQMGTEQEDYVSLTQRIGRKTGGVWTSQLIRESRFLDEPPARLFLRAKARPEQIADLLAIFNDVLHTPRLDDRERFKQIVLTRKARLEASLIPGGHQFVISRLGAHFSRSGWIREHTDGISQLMFLRQLADLIETDWPQVAQTLADIRSFVVKRDSLVLNAVAAEHDLAALQTPLTSLLETLPLRDTIPTEVPVGLPTGSEGLVVPAQVNYVGRAVNLYDAGYVHHGSVHVIMRHLGTSWLWNQIRVQGGAYGAFGRFDHHSGVLSFASYRDPNLEKTLETYTRSADYLRQLDLSEDELHKAIIGTIGGIDQYELPDAKGFSELGRFLMGYDEARRQQMREEILSTTLADFHRFGQNLVGAIEQGPVVVIGDRAGLEKLSANHPGTMTIERIL